MKSSISLSGESSKPDFAKSNEEPLDLFDVQRFEYDHDPLSFFTDL